MKKLARLLLVGAIAGAVSWGGAELVSGRFEPFDSDAGYYFSQVVLSLGAIYAGYTQGVVGLFGFLLAAHVGMNSYSYIAGGSEQRSWALLGMLTTTLLLVYPLILGLAGTAVRLMAGKRGKAD